ncbi:hypothetical protein PR048_011248 [Dryococelus australis]|uniref:Uncharacterized protein n=1 Tax=Dryococelus australis TaxID=614101 RepID=A0ABQ9HLD3_9NEOP|nr:hypothetical protein PR048_011248 [Dryococelus australis]
MLRIKFTNSRLGSRDIFRQKLTTLYVVAEQLKLFASHQSKPGSIPVQVTPRFSQVGIMLDDAAAGWRLEDAEFSRSTAMKAKQSADMELAEVQTQLEEANLAKTEAEERAIIATREQSDARLQLEENEEELAVERERGRAGTLAPHYADDDYAAITTLFKVHPAVPPVQNIILKHTRMSENACHASYALLLHYCSHTGGLFREISINCQHQLSVNHTFTSALVSVCTSAVKYTIWLTPCQDKHFTKSQTESASENEKRLSHCHGLHD